MTTRKRCKKDDHPAWFTRPQIVNLVGVPVITLIGSLVGWYYLTSDTLRRHEGEIASMKTAANKAVDEERRAREETRKSFMDNVLAQTTAMSKIDARLAVQENKVDITNKTLDKIADKLDLIGKAVK
jgi:hypothetical protein